MDNDALTPPNWRRPLFAGLFLNIFLFGVQGIQFFIYWMTFKRDKLWIKSFVALLLFLNVSHTAVFLGAAYQGLVEDYRAIFWVTPETHFLMPTIISTSITIAAVVQIFLSWRIRILTKYNLLFAFVVLCTVASFAMGVASAALTGVRLSSPLRFMAPGSSVQTFVPLWLGITCLTDLSITLGLVLYLKQQMSGYQTYNRTGLRIIRFALQSGLLTATWAIVDLIIHLTVNDFYYTYIIFDFTLPNFYTIAVLSSLNARDTWNKASHDMNVINFIDIVGGTPSAADEENEMADVVSAPTTPVTLSAPHVTDDANSSMLSVLRVKEHG